MSHYNVNKSITLANGIPNVAFHPQLFENINRNPGNKSDLQRVQSDRAFRLPNVDISDLKSPGMWQLTSGSSEKGGNESNSKSVIGTIHTENALGYLFFSERNVNDIQSLIRYFVFKQMNKTIDRQSKQELLIIMRGLYLEYGLHPRPLDSTSDPILKQEIMQETVTEVRRLNELVVNEVVPQVVTQLQQYLDYLRDASSQPSTMDRQINESIAGQKNYRSATQVLLGGNF